MRNFLKLAVLGGVVYLAYKYLYPYLLEKSNKEYADVEEYDENDGKTTFRGEDGVSYVRGYLMPNTINDFAIDKPMLITKPDVFIFNEKPRSGFQVVLDREKNKIKYFPPNPNQLNEIYIADYNEVKDKFVMLENYLKK